MTKKDVEELINENKQLKLELQKLKSKSDFYTDNQFSIDNITTEKTVDDALKITPQQKRFKNMSIDLSTSKNYDINA